MCTSRPASSASLDSLPDDLAALTAIIFAQREENRMTASARADEALGQALKIRIGNDISIRDARPCAGIHVCKLNQIKHG